MSSVPENKRFRRVLRPSREGLIAAGAVGAVAIALSQPSVMSISGLDFKAQRTAAQAIDSLAVGSINRNRHVHGLAGILKPMRLHD